MTSWPVRYCPWFTYLAVLVGRVPVREATATLDAGTLEFRGNSGDATDLRLGRWEHDRTGARGSFVELGGPSRPLRLGGEVLLGDDRYSTAPSARIDGWLERDDFDALLVALEAAGRRARGEPEPPFRPVDHGPRTLTLRRNGRGRRGSLVIDGFELRFEPGDGSRVTLDARYADTEPLIHAVRGRVSFDYPLIHLRGRLSEQEIAIGTDDLRFGWQPEVTAPEAPAATWLLGPAGWRLLVETLGVDRFVRRSGSW